MMVQYLALGKHLSKCVGIFVWTMEMANSLLNALLGYQFYFGTNAPEYQCHTLSQNPLPYHMLHACFPHVRSRIIQNVPYIYRNASCIVVYKDACSR